MNWDSFGASPGTHHSRCFLWQKAQPSKLDNQKNGWKGICIYQQHNGEPLRCLVHALARCVIHLRKQNTVGKDYLSAYFVDGARKNVTAEDISKHLKLAAGLLHYPT